MWQHCMCHLFVVFLLTACPIQYKQSPVYVDSAFYVNLVEVYTVHKINTNYIPAMNNLAFVSIDDFNNCRLRVRTFYTQSVKLYSIPVLKVSSSYSKKQNFTKLIPMYYNIYSLVVR